MRKRWKNLYAKVRADLAGTLATGGLGVAALYVMDAVGAETTVEQKTAIVATSAYVGGKIAAYIRPETGPVVQAPTPPTMDGAPTEVTA